ncbi:hypothetical protein BDW69DRAFT_179904 [Aspergillus filifer]
MPKEVRWTEEAQGRLLLAIVKQVEEGGLKLDYKKLAMSVGPDFTHRNVTRKITALRNRARDEEYRDRLETSSRDSRPAVQEGFQAMASTDNPTVYVVSSSSTDSPIMMAAAVNDAQSFGLNFEYAEQDIDMGRVDYTVG